MRQGQVSVGFNAELKANRNSSSSWFSVLSLAHFQSAKAVVIPPVAFFLPMLHFLHPSLTTPCRFNPFIGINSIFQVSQRIWFCCWDKLLLLISPSLPSPAAPSSLFLCWQKPILDGVSFCVMHLSHQRERLFSHTLQGPLTLRFIVNMEAKADCLLYVMYFRWCPDTLESRDELYHQ